MTVGQRAIGGGPPAIEASGYTNGKRFLHKDGRFPEGKYTSGSRTAGNVSFSERTVKDAFAYELAGGRIPDTELREIIEKAGGGWSLDRWTCWQNAAKEGTLSGAWHHLQQAGPGVGYLLPQEVEKVEEEVLEKAQLLSSSRQSPEIPPENATFFQSFFADTPPERPSHDLALPIVPTWMLLHLSFGLRSHHEMGLLVQILNLHLPYADGETIARLIGRSLRSALASRHYPALLPLIQYFLFHPHSARTRARHRVDHWNEVLFQLFSRRDASEASRQLAAGPFMSNCLEVMLEEHLKVTGPEAKPNLRSFELWTLQHRLLRPDLVAKMLRAVPLRSRPDDKEGLLDSELESHSMAEKISHSIMRMHASSGDHKKAKKWFKTVREFRNKRRVPASSQTVATQNPDSGTPTKSEEDSPLMELEDPACTIDSTREHREVPPSPGFPSDPTGERPKASVLSQNLRIGDGGPWDQQDWVESAEEVDALDPGEGAAMAADSFLPITSGTQTQAVTASSTRPAESWGELKIYLTTLISSLKSDSGRALTAMSEWQSQAEHFPPPISAWNSLLGAIMRDEHVESTVFLRILDHLNSGQSRLPGLGHVTIETITAVMSALLVRREPDTTLQLWRSEVVGFWSDSEKSLRQWHNQNQKVRIARRMEPDATVLGVVMRATIAFGDVDGARNLLDYFGIRSDSSHGVQAVEMPDSPSATQIQGSLRSSSSSESGAEAAGEDMIAKFRGAVRLDPGVFVVLLEALCRSKRWNEVWQVWQDMETVYNVSPDAPCLSLLLEASRFASSARFYGYRTDVNKWDGKEPWRKAREILWDVLEGNWPEKAAVIRNPLGSRFGSFLRSVRDKVFDHASPLGNDTPPEGSDPYSLVSVDTGMDPPAFISRAINASYPSIVPNARCFHAAIKLFGRTSPSDIPLVLAWMRTLEVHPLRKTLKLARLFVEVGGAKPEECRRLWEWLVEWLGEEGVPGDDEVAELMRNRIRVRGRL